MLPIYRVNERNKVSRVHDLRFRSLSKSEYRISLQRGSCAHLSYWTITLVFGRRFRLPLYLLAATGQDFRQFRGFRPDLWSAFVSTWTLHAADIHFPSPNILLFFPPHHHFNVHEITHRTAFALKISSPRRAPPSWSCRPRPYRTAWTPPWTLKE